MKKNTKLVLIASGIVIGATAVLACTVAGVHTYKMCRDDKYWPADRMTYKEYKQLRSFSKDMEVTWKLMEPYAKRESKLKDNSMVYAMMIVPE